MYIIKLFVNLPYYRILIAIFKEVRMSKVGVKIL